jgi:hypothetical protein
MSVGIEAVGVRTRQNESNNGRITMLWRGYEECRLTKDALNAPLAMCEVEAVMAHEHRLMAVEELSITANPFEARGGSP